MSNPGNSTVMGTAQYPLKNAGDLRELMRRAEVAMADLRRGSDQQAADLVLMMHTIEKAIPRMEQDFGIQLKAERARLQTLEGAFRNNAALLVSKAGAKRLQELRRQVEASDTDWWMQLDQMVSQQRGQSLRRLGIRIGAVVAVLAVLAIVYQLFLAPSPDTGARLREAEGYLSQGRLETALTSYKAALNGGAEGPEAPLAIGALLTQLGRDAEAQPYLDQARQRLPSEAEFSAELSLVYYRMASQGGVDAIDKAEAAALQAIAADDTSANAYLALGSVYELRGQVPQAIEALSKASSLSTDTALTAAIQMRLAMLSQKPGDLPTPAAEATAAGQ